MIYRPRIFHPYILPREIIKRDSDFFILVFSRSTAIHLQQKWCNAPFEWTADVRPIEDKSGRIVCRCAIKKCTYKRIVAVGSDIGLRTRGLRHLRQAAMQKKSLSLGLDRPLRWNFCRSANELSNYEI